jgi:ribonuclease P protein component
MGFSDLLRIARGTIRPLHFVVSASRAVPHFGPRATASRGLFVEAHVPTQQPQARQDARFPHPHAHQGGSRRAARSPGSRAEAALRLIWRVRDRATFEALARARRQRSGPVSLRFCRTDGIADPPRVAYAVGRRFGTAVERNRARRRLRAAVAMEQALLLDGGAYLLAAERSVMTVPFPTLREHVATVLRAVREAAA